MKLKRPSTAILFFLMAVLPVGLRAQNAGTAASPGTGQAGNPAAQGNVLQISSPRTGERLRENFVTIQFKLVNAGASAAATPNFELTLDSQDPVTTSSTSYTFNGLKPGPHTVTVQLVDANGTPVVGARAQAQFVVLQPAPTPRAAIALPHHRPALITAALRVEVPKEQPRDKGLASAAGALPLLSVIGFGVLLGGIASAMKTRSK